MTKMAMMMRGSRRVEDEEEDMDSKAVTKTPPKDPVKPEGSGTTGATGCSIPMTKRWMPA